VNKTKKQDASARSLGKAVAGRVLSDFDAHLFREGTHAKLYDKLGCHLLGEPGEEGGASFGVWAPNAAAVSVIGEWNGWQEGASPLAPRPDGSGIWEGSFPQVRRGHTYKYRILSTHRGHVADKADPFAIAAELPPATGSRAWDLRHEWGDAEWMATRGPRLRRLRR